MLELGSTESFFVQYGVQMLLGFVELAFFAADSNPEL
jgi:hypothetical protein